MSFMSPVDMVEEDAADLQFPKAKQVTSNSSKEIVQPATKVKVAQADETTKYNTVFYDAKEFDKKMTQAEENATQESSSAEKSSKNAQLCATCSKYISEPYIKCADCGTLLCLACFASGREIDEHRNSHSYIIVRDNVQVFPGVGNWTAREERLLLRALETQGYGNWDAVARSLHWARTEKESSQHYHDCYFGGIFERLLNLPHARNAYFPQRMPYIAKMRSVDPPRHDDINSMQFKMMAGYRAARGDFDTPYDQSAETLLTMIQDYEDASKENEYGETSEQSRLVEQELKCAIVRAYNHRLQERHRRYRIMRDNGLIMANRTLGWLSQSINTLGSEVNCNRFPAFMQICNPVSFDMMIESMKHFAELRKSIFR